MTFYTDKEVGMLPLELIVLLHINDTAQSFDLVVYFDKEQGKVALDSLALRFITVEKRTAYFTHLTAAINSMRLSQTRAHKRRRASYLTDDSS